MSTISVPIGEVADFNPSSPKASALKGSEIAFVPMASVGEDGTMRVREHRDGSEISNGYSYFQDGDVVVAKITPCYENNKIAVVRIDRDHGFGSTEFHVLRPQPRKIDARYLSYFLRQDGVRALGQKRMTGSAGQRRVPRQFLEQLKIPLPSLDEQQRIAAILDQADSLRRKRREAIEHIDQLGQAIFTEMFGDLRTNPMKWDSVKLGEICVVGSSKRVFVEDFVDSGVPFFRGTEVGKLASKDVVKPELFISQEHYKTLVMHSGKPEIGDLLLPSICHDGRIWLVDTDAPFYFKDGRVLWIKRNESIVNSEFLRYLLQNLFIFSYASIASGTTFAELKIINLKGLSIPLPPLQLQRIFSDIILYVSRYRGALVQAELAADALCISMQRRAFRGEL